MIYCDEDIITSNRTDNVHYNYTYLPVAAQIVRTEITTTIRKWTHKKESLKNRYSGL